MKTNTKIVLVLAIVLSFFSFSKVMAQSKIIAEKTLEVKSGELLRVEAEGSDVSIKSWSSNKAEIKIYGNRKAEENLDIDIQKTSDGVEVIVEKRGGFFSGWFSSMSSKIEIKIPEKFEVFVKTSGGDVTLDNIAGNVELKTSGGDVNTKDTNGELKIYTSGGDVIVSKQEGSAYLSTSGGDIKGHSLKGDVEAKTSGGDIELVVDDGKVEASTSGGDVIVDFMGVNKGIDLHSSGGDVMLQVPKALKGDLYLYSSGGRVRCDLDATKVFTQSKQKFEGKVNGGGEKVYCKTSGGDVEVKY